jgi:hypothetical protein
MAGYKAITGMSFSRGTSEEDRIVLDLANEYAALRNEPVSAAVKKLLREVLPARIASSKRKVKQSA